VNKVNEANTSSLIEWGVAAKSLDEPSGDMHLVKPFPNGVLAAVVDGLGHGDRAAAAARITIAMLERYAHESVVPLFKRCHEELRGKRGVVMSLASFNALEGTMTWLGVGNVNGLFLRADGEANPAHERLLPHGGVIGYRLPSLRPAVIPVTPGDTLLLATDGIRSSFVGELTLPETRLLGENGFLQAWDRRAVAQNGAQQIADYVLARHGRETDDALVLVARYIGGSAQEFTRGIELCLKKC
jgi:negative regulator of sigma-B (phosphoserine phosphatase)